MYAPYQYSGSSPSPKYKSNSTMSQMVLSQGGAQCANDLLSMMSNVEMVPAEEAIADMVQDIDEENVLAIVLPEDYGLVSESWISFLANFKSAEVYDRQVKLFLNWYYER